jgi:O-antigen/teichoic acid export membrane protein
MNNLVSLVPKLFALRKDPLYMNSIFMMASTAMVSGSGFFFWMIATHLYKDTQVGLATTLVSSIGFIMSLAILGFNYSFIRFLPKVKKKSQLLSTGIMIIAIAAALGSAVFLSLLPLFAPKLMFILNSPLTIAAFIFYAITVSVDFATEAIFIALRQGKFIFLKNIGIVFLKFLLPLVFLPFGAFGLFAAWATAISSALIVSSLVLYKKFKFSFKPSFKKINLRQLIKFSFANYFVSLTGIAPALILPIVIANTISVEAAAYFYISFMIANLLYTIPYAVTQSLFAEGSHNESAFLLSITKAVKLMSTILVPAILILIIFGKFILLVFGKSYSSEGVLFLQLLAVAGIPMALNAIGLTILNIHKKMKPLFIINFAGAAVILVLSYILRQHALTGIGIAWLAGHLLKTFIYAGYILAELPQSIKFIQLPQVLRLPLKINS